MKHKALLIESRESNARLYTAYLNEENIDVLRSDPANALNQLNEHSPSLVIIGVDFSDSESVGIINYIRTHQLPTLLIVMTNQGEVEQARNIIKMGVTDYLEKPFNRDRLCLTVRNAIEKHELLYPKQKLKDSYYGFIGASESMNKVYETIDSCRQSDASIFITGESGTGKELCAQAIHASSKRASQELVTINCAAISKTLMESEIFGHVKGAFTGANTDREGAAKTADNGTLFLDELGEMDLELQSKFLRFIQTGEFQRVGSDVVEKVNVRFICATNRNPMEMIRQGTFREDLYYRLQVVPIHLPPLRQRGNDVIAIAQFFLDKYSQQEQKNFKGFSKDAKYRLNQYNWPGNARQLQNIIQNIVVLNDGTEVSLSMLPMPLDLGPADFKHPALNSVTPAQSPTPNLRQTSFSALNETTPPDIESEPYRPSAPASDSEIIIRPLEEVEKEAIEQAIVFCDGNIVKAAALLKINPSTIHRKRKSWLAKSLNE